MIIVCSEKTTGVLEEIHLYSIRGVCYNFLGNERALFLMQE